MSKLLFLHENYQSLVYRVSEGESLFEIGKKFNQTPLQIIRANSLTTAPRTNSLIFVERGKGSLYCVKVGDSLEKIAKTYLVSEQEILTKNAISFIYPYQVIML